MDPIRCPRCHKSLPSVASFCPQCGMGVRSAKTPVGRRPAMAIPPMPARRSRAPGLVVLAIVLAVVFVMVRGSGLRSTTRTFTSSLSSSRVNSATFMGINSPGQRVAYVCTAGGTSRNTIDMFLAEMRQSVGRLDDAQAFNVCFTAASDGMLDQSSFLQAVLANKRRAFNMNGRLNFAGALPDAVAMQRVMAQGPETIFLMADADLSPGNEEFVGACRAHRRGIRIHTIAVRTRENQADAGRRRFEDALRRIATESGGQFKTVQGR